MQSGYEIMIVQQSCWLYFEGCNGVQLKSNFTQIWRKNLMIWGRYFYIEVKKIPGQAHWRPRWFQKFEASRFRDNRHMKVVKLSIVRNGRLYPSVNIPDIHFCQRLCQHQDHNAARRIMSMKIFQLHHQESKPLPSDLQCVASINCITASPFIFMWGT